MLAADIPGPVDDVESLDPAADVATAGVVVVDKIELLDVDFGATYRALLEFHWWHEYGQVKAYRDKFDRPSFNSFVSRGGASYGLIRWVRQSNVGDCTRPDDTFGRRCVAAVLVVSAHK